MHKIVAWSLYCCCCRQNLLQLLFFFSFKGEKKTAQDLYSLYMVGFGDATWLHLEPFVTLIYDVLLPRPVITANTS